MHKETRKSYNKIILKQICEMEKILENKKLEDHSLTQIQLQFEL